MVYIFTAKSGMDIESSSEYIDIKQSSTNVNEFYVGTPVSLYSKSPESIASYGNCLLTSVREHYSQTQWF